MKNNKYNMINFWLETNVKQKTLTSQVFTRMFKISNKQYFQNGSLLAHKIYYKMYVINEIFYK